MLRLLAQWLARVRLPVRLANSGVISPPRTSLVASPLFIILSTKSLTDPVSHIVNTLQVGSVSTNPLVE